MSATAVATLENLAMRHGLRVALTALPRSKYPALCPPPAYRSKRHCRYLLKEDSTMIFVLVPPHAYDHPYSGHFIEQVIPLAQARTLCGKRGVSSDACSWIENGTCHIVIPRGGPVKSLASYRRHEVAHCNGWPASHPRF
jgi:hypothetical protein